MSSHDKVTIEIHWAWWWPMYTHGLLLVAVLCSREPDWGKFRATARRAIRFRVRHPD